MAMLRLMASNRLEHPPFAPPFLRSGKLLIAQTANILLYLGPRHGLAPASEADRLFAHQLQLTVTDLVQEVHDTHHPISTELYYEEQRRAAKQRSEVFLKHRVPKFLGYFERVLARNAAGKGFLIGGRLTYPRSVAVPDRRRPALRLPPGHEAHRAQPSPCGGAARQGRGPPADRRLPRFAPAHPLQRGGDLPALPGAQYEAVDPSFPRPRPPIFLSPSPRAFFYPPRPPIEGERRGVSTAQMLPTMCKLFPDAKLL